MKKKFLFVMGLFSLMMLTACSSEDDKTKDMTAYSEIYDLTGYISYINEQQAWCFISGWPMDDAFHGYYIIGLEDDFKAEGLVVTVSGNIYKNEEDQRYYIKITEIEKCSNTKGILDKIDYLSMQIEDCYSGYVTDVEEDDILIKALLKDEDLIKVQITETPCQDYLFRNDYPKDKIIYFLKSDFQDSDFQKGDIVDFRIVRYKELERIFIYANCYCSKYFCSVKPCK